MAKPNKAASQPGPKVYTSAAADGTTFEGYRHGKVGRRFAFRVTRVERFTDDEGRPMKREHAVGVATRNPFDEWEFFANPFGGEVVFTVDAVQDVMDEVARRFGR